MHSNPEVWFIWLVWTQAYQSRAPCLSLRTKGVSSVTHGRCAQRSRAQTRKRTAKQVISQGLSCLFGYCCSHAAGVCFLLRAARSLWEETVQREGWCWRLKKQNKNNSNIHSNRIDSAQSINDDDASGCFFLLFFFFLDHKPTMCIPPPTVLDCVLQNGMVLLM